MDPHRSIDAPAAKDAPAAAVVAAAARRRPVRALVAALGLALGLVAGGPQALAQGDAPAPEPGAADEADAAAGDEDTSGDGGAEDGASAGASADAADADDADDAANADDTTDPDDADPLLPLRTTQMCIDETIANRLTVKRQRREAVDRLFVKQARHELSAMGGYYSSDLFSGTYVASGSYTYHITEHFAVEFGGSYTNANADIIRAVEDRRATVIDNEFERVILAESLLLWSPVYGKLRLGGTILRFDLNAGVGVGVVDAATSRGAAGVAGVGMKLFLGRALAIRIDARNHVFQQELLDSQFLVNDVSITSGLSLFLPFQN